MAGNDNTNIEIKLTDVRLSFADIFEAKAFGDDPDGRPRFSANFLIDKIKQKDQAEKVSAAVKKAIAAKWPTNPPKLGADKKCFRDGEPKDEETEERTPLYEGYAGHYFVSAASPADRPPVIIDSRKGADGKFPRLTQKDGKPYAGCYVNAVIRVWAQDSQTWGRRVNASLEAIQFARHGEAFGATRIDAESTFDDLGGEDDDFAPSKSMDDDDLV